MPRHLGEGAWIECRKFRYKRTANPAPDRGLLLDMTAPLNGLNELDCLKIIAGNVSGGGGGSSTLALPVTFTATGRTSAVWTMNNGSGTELNELWLATTNTGGNVLGLRNNATSNALATIKGVDASGNEKFALGAGTSFAGTGPGGTSTFVFLESSDIDNGVNVAAPPIFILMTGNYGSGSGAQRIRQQFNADGSVSLNDKIGTPVVSINAGGTTLTLGNTTEGGMVSSVLLHSPTSMGSGQSFAADATLTGFGFPRLLFNQNTAGVLDGAGFSTTTGDDIGVTINQGTATLTNSTTTSGSTTATVSSTTGLIVGQPVFSAGIPLNATVASVVDGTHFTLSAAATVSSSTKTIIIPGYFNPMQFNAAGTITVGALSTTFTNPTTLNGATIQSKSNNYVYFISGDTATPKTTSNAWYWLLPAWGFGQDGNMELHQVIGGSDVGIMKWLGSNGKTIFSNGKVNIAGIPTSSSGLVSGDVYSNAGILTIVP